jgi:hypothetical protein
MASLVENMDITEQNIWSPIEAPLPPIYTRPIDSGYNSTSLNKESKSIAVNNKMVYIRDKRKDNRLRMGLDYELASFWESAESPCWPCKKKTLQKVDVDCRLNTNEDFVKHMIKTVYHSYQDSCHSVDGSTDHISNVVENVLKSQTNESLLSNNNEIALFDINSAWTVHVCLDAETKEDINSILNNDLLDLTETSRLKFTAKQTSHIMHLNHKQKLSGIMFGKLSLKRHSQRTTCITASNDNLHLTFHFTE